MLLALLTSLVAAAAPVPPGARVIDGLSQPLELDTGEQVVVRGVCRIARIAASAQPFDVAPLDADRLLLEGYQEGRGTLVLWCEDGSRRSAVITVHANEPLAAARRYLRDREKLGDAAPVPPGFQQGEASRVVQLEVGATWRTDVASTPRKAADAVLINDDPSVVQASLGGKAFELVARKPGVAVIRVRGGERERVYLVIVKG